MSKIILYVDDNPDDQLLVQILARDTLPDADFRFARSGDQVIAWLNGTGIYSNRQSFPMPDVIVTDIRLPHMDGMELIRKLRADTRFSRLPIIVYSGAEPECFYQAAQAGATKCLRKMEERVTLLEYLTALFSGGRS